MIAAVLVAAQLSTVPVPCPTPQPAPGFVCQDGGWYPPGHPDIRQVAPPPPPPPTTVRFRLGRRYVRGTTDLYMAGVGQLADDVPVFFAQCLAVGDGCFHVGYVRPIYTGTNAQDFIELPPPAVP